MSVPTGKPNAGLNRLKAPAMTKRPIEPRNPPKPTQSSCGNPYGVMTDGMLEKAASGVLRARRTLRTVLYASSSSLCAALLDGPF